MNVNTFDSNTITSSETVGASKEEWRQASESSLSGLLVPVCAGEKKPSIYNTSNGQALPVSWTKMNCEFRNGDACFEYSNKAGKKRYRNIGDNPKYSGMYGFGIRLGTVLAIDSDVDDEKFSIGLLTCLKEATGHERIPRRIREGSSRWACLLRFSDVDGELANAVGKAKEGDVELKGKSHILVCAGMHPSGAHYRWVDGQCLETVSITKEQFEDFLNRCTGSLEIRWKDSDRESICMPGNKDGVRLDESENFDINGDDLGKWLLDNGYVKRKEGSRLHIVCPWESEHGNGCGERDATYFCAVNGGFSGFKCFHAHCSDRHISELARWAEENGFKTQSMLRREATASEFGIIPETDGGQAAEVITQEEGERRFRENNGTEVTIMDGGLPRKVKRVKPCIDTMNKFLKDEVACGMHIAFDSFLEDIFVTDHRKSGAKPEPWDEYRTVPELLTRAERTFGDGINNMPLQGQWSTFEKLFFGMAHQNTFDSAVDRLNSLPKWDGTKRLDAWLVDYCGVKDSDHKGERLLSRYMIIVACARMGNTKRSGIKADILPVFYGEQGKGKSTIVKYLSLLGEDGFFDGLRFDGKKDDTIRDTLGKCICEIGELGGLNNGKKDRNDLKNWITSSTDRMTQKYEKKAVDHPRRYLPVMTTNEQHFLNDPTGNRRFAPVTVAETGEARLDDLQRDMEQIYAEALAVCNGIPTQKDVLDAWRPLDKVLPLMSKKFVEEDVLYRRVLIAAQKLYEGRNFVTIDNIMTSPEGLGWGTDRADNRQARRFADVLRKHGWKCDHKGYYMTDETEIIADDGTERSDGDEPF